MDKNVSLERITPKLATEWLNHNRGNRKLREGKAEQYAQDMKAGNWTQCLDPIAFYADGDIANGQHRLWAIVESETTQEFIVIRNFPRDAGLNIDTQIGRTIVDNARISGADAALSNELVAACLFYENGNKLYTPISNADRLACVARHRGPVQWAVSHGPVGRGYRNMVMLSAVARAFAAGADPERLVAFCKVMTTGVSDGSKDTAAIALRNYIIARGHRVLSHEMRDFFLKAQNAIYYFLKGRPLGVIKSIKDETYPLRPKRAVKAAA